jgi:glycosyltransferase involved in cell wall biosynthesis
MRIGLISEMYGGTTPPVAYGGISATMYDLTCEFVRRGHDVTLFATPGSRADGARIIICKPGDRPVYQKETELAPYAVEALKHLGEIDVWIDGSHHKHFAWTCMFRHPYINVLCPSWNPNASDLPQNTVVQSPAMIEGIGTKPKDTPWFFGGIPLDEYEPCYEMGGRGLAVHVMTTYKGIDTVVQAASKHHFPLDLYGHVPHQPWFDQAIQPLVDKHHNIVYHGPCGIERKQYMAQASAFFLIARWWEPGSRAVLEAMACGCPVVLTKAGTLKYYLEGGGGVYVEDNPEAVFNGYRRVINGGSALRRRARQVAEELFSLTTYADNWERMFERVMKGDRWP